LLIGCAVALTGLQLACQPNPANQATLASTLQVRGSQAPIAYENDIPVPSFGAQRRPTILLGGEWRFQPARLDHDLTMGDRSHTLGAIDREAGGRQTAGYDDSGWQPLAVPGSFDNPSSSPIDGGWYRRTFEVPVRWDGLAATLKFAAARYVADVWVNGSHVGYHEGGSTPFAFDVSRNLVPGAANTLAVRVDNPTWGTRNDILPWGLADWRNYGGLVGPVWIEASDPLYVSRADVVPHLDGADVSVLLRNSGSQPREPQVTLELYSAALTDANLLDPDPAALIPTGAQPLSTYNRDLGQVGQRSVTLTSRSIPIRDAALWEPTRPSLYVVHVVVREKGTLVDETYESFGLRQIKVDSTFPQLLFNGGRIAFRGVATHDERLQPAVSGRPAGGPMTDSRDFLDQLRRVQSVHADLVRADHNPPSAWLPLLADRLGIAIWEEIPFYHYTPETFDILMGRGIPQQMLVEMDLRDYNRASVLFHGFANESTGTDRRQSALSELRDLDRRVDGTRLTGQAAYGSDPSDLTSTPLDVAGFTFYWGVFYGGQLSTQLVEQELARAHQAYPRKPIMILEFGRWADTPEEEAIQQPQVFDLTYGGFAPHLGDRPGGYIGSVVWWSLDDYWTDRPGITVEHFGLFRPDGSQRPVAASLSQAYAEAAPPQPPNLPPLPGGSLQPSRSSQAPTRLLLFVGYAILVPAVALLALVLVLNRRPRRLQGRRG
jgi:beta-galactosidase